MRRMGLIAMAVALSVGFAGAGTGLTGNETTTVGESGPDRLDGTTDAPIREPSSRHPCKPGSGCEATREVAPVMMDTDGNFHFENDVHMEDGTTLTMENGSVFQVREQANLLIPAEAPRLFSGGVATFGTADDNPLRLVVDNETGLRLLPAPTPNVIGGNASNLVPDGVTGATIGGGGTDVAPNEVLADFATVSGGSDNVASGVHAIVVGGEANTASGQGSLAGGQGADALHDGSFVWSDSDPAGIASSGPDQFIVDASGGVGVGTDAPASALTVGGDVTPATNASHALGSTDLRWTDVWLSSVIHHSGDLEFENDDGVVTGTLSDTGNLTLPGTLAADALEGDASNLTGVQADEIAEDSVNSSSIVDQEVETVDLADDSVTAAKLGEACAQDQVLKVDSTGAWACADDLDTTYTGGTGITVTSSDTIENDLGDSIESSEITDGAVDTADLAGDAVTTTEIADATIKRADLAQDGCADAEILKFDMSTGSWVCAVDEDTQTDTIPWSDVTDKPAGFADDVDDDTLAGLGCASSEIAKWDGTAWTCAVDEDSGGDITAVNANTGLTGGGTSGDVSLAVDTSAIQQRVTGTCGTNESIDAINEDGTVSCETDDALRGTSCSSGDVVTGVDIIGRLLCEADQDTTYTAGDGLELNSGTFEVRQDCNSQAILKVQESRWVCGADDVDGGNAETVDSLDSSQLLRSDVDDTFTGSLLTIDGDLQLGAGDGRENRSIVFDHGLEDARIDWESSNERFLVNYDIHGQSPISGPSLITRNGDINADGRNLFLLSSSSQDFTDVVFGDGSSTTPDIDVEIASGGVCIDDDGSCTPAVDGDMSLANGAMCLDNDGGCATPADGEINALAFNTGSSDVAEVYPSDDQLQAGEVVTLDEDEPGHFERTRKAGQEGPLRVVSTDPGMLLGAPSDEALEKAGLLNDRAEDGGKSADKKLLPGTYPVALSGRVPVKASVENDPISVGDPLTSSSVPGIAMKATDADPVLGHAMEELTVGTGTVKAFVTPGAQEPRDGGANEERVHRLEQENQQLEEKVDTLNERVEKLESIVEDLANEHEGVE